MQQSQDSKDTCNGVGKSSALNLLHLMFGGDNKNPKLAEMLKTYGNFYLSFRHGNREYRIEKDFSQSEFIINKEIVKKTLYGDRLKKMLLPSDYVLSFRQVFNCFARKPSSDYYIDSLRQQGQPKEDYYQKFVNLTLLGIRIDLVEKNNILKTKMNALGKVNKTLKEYQKLFEESNDTRDLQEELEKLKKDKSNFIIAKNYDGLRQELEKQNFFLEELREKSYLLSQSLKRKQRNLDSSLTISVDSEMIRALYEEALFFFKDKVVRRLEDAQNFHNTLIFNRKNRLKDEISELKERIADIERNMDSCSQKRDEILRILDAHGALQDYHVLENKINSLEKQIQDLTKYKAILDGFNKQQQELKNERDSIKNESERYLEQQQKYLNELENIFKEIVKRFYNNSRGSLSIKTTKDAKYLYDVDLQIPRQDSQAINEVKIFCYDMLLYEKNKDLLNFIAHDGCIFSEMDPRQKATIFKVVLEMVERNGLQYFINVSHDSLLDILAQDILSDREKTLIKQGIILELNDSKDPKDWLFGCSF
ncbi:DUF2326 domain-containing protein [Helicobacter cetorum]|uniref:DUF2326 domain-containing protein n=1 Tax=Helicobacter cetorum TaxID=138563 RepID=UPI00131571B6|nr:DUF2326 domain-containing protein [Helicobacter cetorum]